MKTQVSKKLLLLFLLVMSNTFAMKQHKICDDCPELSRFIELTDYTVTIQHETADLFECEIPSTNVFLLFLEAYMREAAILSGATPFEYTMHQFEPDGSDGSDGFSAFLILNESHLSVHYWGEERFAAIDIMTYGKCEPRKAIDHLVSKFKPKDIEIQSIKRPK